MSALGVVGDQVKEPVVEKAGKVVEPYTPLSERTRMALEALKKCSRVSVLKLEVLDTWEKAYPDVDLAAWILKAEAWAQSDNVNRSARGWQKHLNWRFGAEQNRSKGNTYNPTIANKVAAPVAIEEETRKWIEAAQ